jgi:hypothetical protein
MTPRQRELARHALGLPNERDRSYRNRFCCSSGANFDDWMAMAEAGEARFVDPGTSTMRWFALTETGAREALQPLETLDPEDFPEVAHAL